MKNSNNINTRQSKQARHKNRPDIRDDMDSRKQKEEGYKDKSKRGKSLRRDVEN